MDCAATFKPNSFLYAAIPYTSGTRASWDGLTEHLYPPYIESAGWSSPVARWAHNPKVVGSNPTPATNKINQLRVEFE